MTEKKIYAPPLCDCYLLSPCNLLQDMSAPNYQADFGDLGNDLSEWGEE